MTTPQPMKRTAAMPCVQALRDRDVLLLPQAEGQMVVCTEGTVWISLEPAPAAEPGPNRLRVRALSDACVHLVPVNAPAH